MYMKTLAVAMALALGSACALQREEGRQAGAAADQSRSRQDTAPVQRPYHRPDDSWISIGGTVVSTGADAFTLDYGDGTIRVEMDDWDWYDEGRLLIRDDEVRVYGRVDEDLYERRSIEASAVFVKGLGSYFYANDVDEEDVGYAVGVPVAVAATEVTGRVTAVGRGQFTLDTGERKLRIDTGDMAYDPLDNEGYQKVEEGDRVSVSGTLDSDFFHERTLDADYVTLLTQDRTRQSQGDTQGAAQSDTRTPGQGERTGMQQRS